MVRYPVPDALSPDDALRVGVGVDVHALAAGRPLYLAGLLWPGEAGLTGHSDGDVAGLGDLGSNFGTAEPAWAGACGPALLRALAALLAGDRFALGNVAIQVIGT